MINSKIILYAPEIKSINEDMLSEYQKYLNDKLNIKYD